MATLYENAIVTERSRKGRDSSILESRLSKILSKCRVKKSKKSKKKCQPKHDATIEACKLVGNHYGTFDVCELEREGVI